MASLISDEFADDLEDMLRWWRERGPGEAPMRRDPQPRSRQVAVVTLSATTTSVVSGVTYYSAATRVERTPGTSTWVTKDDVYVREINGLTPTINTKYVGTVTEFVNGRMVYEIDASGGVSVPVFSGAQIVASTQGVTGGGGSLVIEFDDPAIYDTDGYWDSGSPTLLTADGNYAYLLNAEVGLSAGAGSGTRFANIETGAAGLIASVVDEGDSTNGKIFNFSGVVQTGSTHRVTVESDDNLNVDYVIFTITRLGLST